MAGIELRPLEEIIERSIRAGLEVRVEQSQGDPRPRITFRLTIPVPPERRPKPKK